MRIDTAKYGLRIVQPYRITKEEVAQRKRNLWLGLCQDRKLFWNPEYIKAVLGFAAAYTKDDVLVVVPDAIRIHTLLAFTDHTIRGRERVAQKVAAEEMRKFRAIIDAALGELPADVLSKIKLCMWDDYLCDPRNARLVDRAVALSRENGSVIHRLCEPEMRSYCARKTTRLLEGGEQRLMTYLASEAAVILYGPHDDGKHYDVQVYPEIEGLQIAADQQGLWPELNEAFGETGKNAIMAVALQGANDLTFAGDNEEATSAKNRDVVERRDSSLLVA